MAGSLPDYHSATTNRRLRFYTFGLSFGSALMAVAFLSLIPSMMSSVREAAMLVHLKDLGFEIGLDSILAFTMGMVENLLGIAFLYFVILRANAKVLLTWIILSVFVDVFLAVDLMLVIINRGDEFIEEHSFQIVWMVSSFMIYKMHIFIAASFCISPLKSDNYYKTRPVGQNVKEIWNYFFEFSPRKGMQLLLVMDTLFQGISLVSFYLPAMFTKRFEYLPTMGSNADHKLVLAEELYLKIARVLIQLLGLYYIAQKQRSTFKIWRWFYCALFLASAIVYTMQFSNIKNANILTYVYQAFFTCDFLLRMLFLYASLKYTEQQTETPIPLTGTHY